MFQFQTFLTEGSLASAQAKKLGLTYYGFGRYGKKNTVTHHSMRGRLVPVKEQYHSSKGESPLMHYEHLEDGMFNKGKEGAHNTLDILYSMIHDPKHVEIGTKVDGSPSLFFGKKNGKFFVATKSLYNKNPKINFTPEDIERNHGDAPGLVQKLKVALKHLPKIYRGGDNETLQGDMMYTPDDVSTKEIDAQEHYTFRPNTIRSAIPVHSSEGRKIKKSKIGFAVHTKYNDQGERLPAGISDIGSHEDVYSLDTTPSPSQKMKDTSSYDIVAKMIDSTPDDVFSYVSRSGIGTNIKSYYNSKIRTKTQDDINSNDFIEYIKQIHQKEIDKLKSEAGKAKKTMVMNNLIEDLSANKKKIDTAFKIYKSLIQAKHDIIDHLNKNQSVKTYFDNEDGTLKQTNPEGYVVVGNSGTHKLVKRHEFSHANFTLPKTWETQKKKDHAVVTIGRMSPPHRNHARLIDTVLQHAEKTNGDPHIFVTHTQDNKKNPLTGDEKLEVLHHMYPDKKHIFHQTDKQAPTIFQQLEQLYKKGYKSVDLIVGDDRKDDMDVIKKYNGVIKDGRGYKFDNIGVMAMHDEGVHASAIRQAAIEGDMDTFRNAMHPNVPEETLGRIFNAIRDRVKPKEEK